MRLIMIIALAAVTASLIGVALSFKTAAKTEAPSAPVYGVVHVTVPEGMKALPAELVPVD